jgi:hypothetical protein
MTLFASTTDGRCELWLTRVHTMNRVKQQFELTVDVTVAVRCCISSVDTELYAKH